MKRKNRILLLGISGTLSVAALGGVLVSCSKTNVVNKEVTKLGVVKEDAVELHFTADKMSDDFIKGLQGEKTKANFDAWIKTLGSDLTYTKSVAEGQEEKVTVKTFSGEESWLTKELENGVGVSVSEEFEYGTRKFVITLSKEKLVDTITLVRDFTDEAAPIAKLFTDESKIYFENKELVVPGTLTASTFAGALVENQDNSESTFAEVKQLFNKNNFESKLGYKIKEDAKLDSTYKTSFEGTPNANDKNLQLSLTHKDHKAVFNLTRQDREDYSNIRNLFTEDFLTANNSSVDFIDMSGDKIKDELLNESLKLDVSNIINNSTNLPRALFETNSEVAMTASNYTHLKDFMSALTSNNVSSSPIANPLNLENELIDNTLKIQATIQKDSEKDNEYVATIIIKGSVYSFELTLTMIPDQVALTLQNYANVSRDYNLNYDYNKETNTYTTNEVLVVNNLENIKQYIDAYRKDQENVDFLAKFNSSDVSFLNALVQEKMVSRVFTEENTSELVNEETVTEDVADQEKAFNTLVSPEGYTISMDLSAIDNASDTDKARINLLTKSLKVSLVPTLETDEEGNEIASTKPTYTMNILLTQENMANLVNTIPANLDDVKEVKDVNGTTTLVLDSVTNKSITLLNKQLSTWVKESNNKELINFILSNIVNKNNKVTDEMINLLTVSVNTTVLNESSEKLIITVAATNDAETKGKYAFSFVITSKLTETINAYNSMVDKSIETRKTLLAEAFTNTQNKPEALTDETIESLKTTLNTRTEAVLSLYKNLSKSLLTQMNDDKATHLTVMEALTTSYADIFKAWRDNYIHNSLTLESPMLKDILISSDDETKAEETKATNEAIVKYVNTVIAKWKAAVSQDLLLLDSRTSEMTINADGLPVSVLTNATGSTLDLLKALYSLGEWKANATQEFDTVFNNAINSLTTVVTETTEE